MKPVAALLDEPLSARARWGVVLGAGLVAAVLGCGGIREFDQWFHMAWGRAFVEGGGFPAHDPFLFPFLDKPPLGNGEWLGSVGLYLSWVVGGDVGTVLLVGLLFGATVAIMVRDALEGDEAPRWADAAVALVVAALAIGVIRRRAVGRPEIFAYPMLAWTLWASRRWLGGRGRAILAFPIVALVWASTHLTVLYGLGAALALAAEGWVRGRLGGAEGAPLRRRSLQLAAVAAVATLVAYFFGGGSAMAQGVKYALDLLGVRFGPAVGAGTQESMDLMHGVIIELQPPVLAYYLTSAGGLIALFAVGALVAWRKARPFEIALAAAGLLFAVRAGRFMPLFALLATASTARNLAAGIARLPPRLGALRWGLVPAIPAALVWTLAVIPMPLGLGRAPELFPSYVADVLVRAGAAKIPGLRVYNTFHYGGYLEWALGAPVLYNDGRLTWPPGEAKVAMTASGARTIAWLDARWRFDALVLENFRTMPPEMRKEMQGHGFDLMADREEFALVALDDAAQLYVRRTGRLASLLADEYRVVSPTRIPTPQDLDDPLFVSHLRGEYARALAANPGSVYCRAGLYLGHLAAGDADAAERLFPGGRLPPTQHPLGNGSLDVLYDGLRVLGRLRMFNASEAIRAGRNAEAERLLRISLLAAENPVARNKLGGLLADRGDSAAAEQQFRRAIELEPGFLEPRLHLAILLGVRGRPDAAREILQAIVQHAPRSPEATVARERLRAMDGALPARRGAP